MTARIATLGAVQTQLTDLGYTIYISDVRNDQGKIVGAVLPCAGPEGYMWYSSITAAPWNEGREDTQENAYAQMLHAVLCAA